MTPEACRIMIYRNTKKAALGRMEIDYVNKHFSSNGVKVKINSRCVLQMAMSRTEKDGDAGNCNRSRE